MHTAYKIALCAALLLCAGCNGTKEQEAQSNWGSPEYAQSTTTKVVSIEGCNVYRFEDYGGLHYATVCSRAPQMPPPPQEVPAPQIPDWRPK